MIHSYNRRLRRTAHSIRGEGRVKKKKGFAKSMPSNYSEGGCKTELAEIREEDVYGAGGGPFKIF